MPIDLSCSACGRKVTAPRWFQGSAYGSVCFREVAGEALRRGRRAAGMRRPAGLSLEVPRESDPNQRDLFSEDLAYAQRVDSLLSSISLEMPA